MSIKNIQSRYFTKVLPENILLLNYELEKINAVADGSIELIILDNSYLSMPDFSRLIPLCIKKLKSGGSILGKGFLSNFQKAIVTVLEDVLIVDEDFWIYTVKDTFSIDIKHDEHLNLFEDYSQDIHNTYIIALENNTTSQTQLKKCVSSLEKFNMPYSVFYGYDGTDKETIKTPEHLKNNSFMKTVKLYDQCLSITETACALSHIALWFKCLELNKPILILEHDALMLRPYTKHNVYNSLIYLGHKLTVKGLSEKLGYGIKSFDDTVKLISDKPNILPFNYLGNPLTQIINKNFMFVMGLHAYSIDPAIARRLISGIISDGLINPIDSVVQLGKYNLSDTGLYATQLEDCETQSTISIDTAVFGNMFRSRKNTYTLPAVSKGRI
jgi:GR25 family glycosyltransferase involved in LPS biosynthesis